MDQAKLDELKTTHGGDVEVFKAGDYEFALRPPAPHIWKLYRRMLYDEKKRPDALEFLARECVVYPDRPGFDAILNRKPGFAETLANKLLDMAGMGADLEKA